jgi:hypothetical protein
MHISRSYPQSYTVVWITAHLCRAVHTESDPVQVHVVTWTSGVTGSLRAPGEEADAERTRCLNVRLFGGGSLWWLEPGRGDLEGS